MKGRPQNVPVRLKGKGQKEMAQPISSVLCLVWVLFFSSLKDQLVGDECYQQLPKSD